MNRKAMLNLARNGNLLNQIATWTAHHLTVRSRTMLPYRKMSDIHHRTKCCYHRTIGMVLDNTQVYLTTTMTTDHPNSSVNLMVPDHTTPQSHHKTKHAYHRTVGICQDHIQVLPTITMTMHHPDSSVNLLVSHNPLQGTLKMLQTSTTLAHIIIPKWGMSYAKIPEPLQTQRHLNIVTATQI